jgi:uncharacterized protein (TIGR03437 family)
MLSALPALLRGYSTGPPIKRTGAIVDGGINCSACHRTFAPANSDPTGSVAITAADYTPGVRQTIKVTVSHPSAARWGFQLSARTVNDENKPAGTFAANDVVKIMCDDGSTLGTGGPCTATQLQFAEHISAPRGAAGDGFTFTVDWTPPATDVGDVIFYAAGNAANGDGSFNGDRIYTTSRRISPPCTLSAQPTIKSMTNGASFQPAWSVGSMLTIFGGNFGAAGRTRAVGGADIVSHHFPLTLACVAVTINGQNAPMVYVQPDQINLQAPAISGVGSASVVVIVNPGTANELRSDTLTVASQQAYAPAFFTFNGKSVAATSADGANYLADAAIVAKGVAAKPGDTVILYASGLGATNPAIAPGEIATAAPVTGSVSLSVGGISVPPSDILYAGLSPQAISGLYQLNVRLPVLLPDGDAVVALAVGGAQSISGTTLPIKK